jgi:thioredoxin 1
MTIIRLILCAVLVSSAALAHALDIQPYSAATLAAAQKANKPVVLQFRADWCPTCRAQDKVLESLKAEPGLNLTVLAVNYDTEKDLKKQFNVRTQSTLVMLHGLQERGRVLNATSPEAIRAALKTAL